MGRITYDQIQENLLTDWYIDTEKDVTQLIKDSGNEWKTMLLIRDIAQSLRVLRCHNFTGIPSRLFDMKSTHNQTLYQLKKVVGILEKRQGKRKKRRKS